MPTQRMKVDIAKLALNLDGCRFGSPPSTVAVVDHPNNNDTNEQQNNNDKLSSSPLSTYHLNHMAQYNSNSSNRHHHNTKTTNSNHYYNSSNELLTSPLGTTYRREGLSIGHNFLRFHGSALRGNGGNDNFNSNMLDVLECVGRGVCSSVWKARRRRRSSSVEVEDGVDVDNTTLGGQLDREAEGEALSSKQQQQEEHEIEGEEEYYALKIFSMRDPQKRTMLIRELKLLCSTTNATSSSSDDDNDKNNSQGQECECLVELEGAFLDELDGTVTLVLEYMNFGSLADLLSPPSSSSPSPSLYHSNNNNNKMPEYALASIAYQMIWGLGYLHHTGVLHRDVKPGNVLLSSEGRVKLADFGIVSNNNSPYFNGDTTTGENNDDGNGGGESDDNDAIMNVTMIGTTRYMSPERLHGLPYNKQADIWSLGLILLECTRGGGNSPFEHISSMVELVQTLDDCSSMGEYIPNGISAGLTEILMGCLNFCLKKRMPADVLIGSPWFEENGITCVDDAVMGMRRYLETLQNKE